MRDQILAYLEEIRERLERIEGQLAYQNDAASHVSISEKAEIVKRALRTGDKQAIKQAMKRINGGK